jgi:hypothetical protein
MRKLHYSLVVLLAVVMMSTCLAAWSQGTQFSPRELDEILAPIALYPDPLLAQIFSASTFPQQLNAAADMTNFQPTANIIDNQNWDASVKAVAYYPRVLRMMVEKPDWTVSIGQAYDQQPNDVLNSVQRLRFKAKGFGYLHSTPQQRVYVEDGYLRIVPTQSGYIYVPEYDPSVVYVRRGVPDAFIFAAGLLVGAWLNRDVDWHHHYVYYHGWSGPGWVSYCRPRVHITNVYVNNYYHQNRVFVSDHTVLNRNIGSFREQIRTSHPGNFALANQIRRPGANNRFGTPPTHIREMINRQPAQRWGNAGRTNSMGASKNGGQLQGYTKPHGMGAGIGKPTSAKSSKSYATKPTGKHGTATGSWANKHSNGIFGQQNNHSGKPNNGQMHSNGMFGKQNNHSNKPNNGQMHSNSMFGKQNNHSSKPNNGQMHSNGMFGKSETPSGRHAQTPGGHSTDKGAGHNDRSHSDKSKNRDKDQDNNRR